MVKDLSTTRQYPLIDLSAFAYCATGNEIPLISGNQLRTEQDNCNPGNQGLNALWMRSADLPIAHNFILRSWQA
jgi:hypothetical protein